MPAERPAPTKASENRRATKPIMEKRRRARINQCLAELKGLILDALNKDPSRHSKLEKADILEMTVRHLQNVQRQQMAAAISTDHTVLNKFRAGFGECANEVSRYVSRIEGVEQGIRQRLVNYLSNCVSSLNAATPFTPPATPGTPGAASMAFPGMTPPFGQGLVSPLHVQIPAGLTIGFLANSAAGAAASMTVNDINNNSNGKGPGLSLLPASRLPNGDLAFLLPSQALPAGTGTPAHPTPTLGAGIPMLSATSSSDIPASASSFPSRSSLSSWGQDTAPLSPRSPLLSAGSVPSPASSVGSGLSLSGSETGSDVSAESAKPKPRSPSPPSSPSKKSRVVIGFTDHRLTPDAVAEGEHHRAPAPTFQPTSVIQRPTTSNTNAVPGMPKNNVNSTSRQGDGDARVSPVHRKENTDQVWRPW